MPRAKVNISESPDTTRQRIIDAASRVFAEKGLEHATIREIVELAGANIAAVNYHFQGKSELYSSVLTHLLRSRHEAYPFDAGLPAKPIAKQRLHGFILAMLRRMLLDEDDSVLGRLMIREMIEPTHVLDELVRDVMNPTSHYLQQIIEQIVERKLNEQERFHAITSVIGQVVFHKHCRSVVDRMFGSRVCTSAQVEQLAAHISAFTYAGLRQMRHAKSGKTPKAARV